MFFTGYSRAAESSSGTAGADRAGRRGMIEDLDVQELGPRFAMPSSAATTRRFAGLMHEHWVAKRALAGCRTDDRSLVRARAGNGALGGKLVGAGAGGFLLLRRDDRPRSAGDGGAGLPEVRFAFDHDGSSVIVRG